MSDHVIDCRQLKKSYYDGNHTIDVLAGIDFSIQKGDRLAVVGPSGSGKSTFLHLLGGLDKPSAGEVLIQGTNWQDLTEKKRCQLRNKTLGFIYQFHHLLPEFTALENVSLPLLLRGNSVNSAQNEAKEILNQVGLSAREDHKPSQLSGGERQRVAIARALVHNPHCVLADEPTGNLDHATAVKVFELMLELNRKLQTALVIVTHDMNLAQRMNRVMHVQDGQLVEG
ncbi:lipoprotein-releasing ABC transporter ATP-binding protein LolD [Legionella impletisoli]|uniref:Lipoprotein-releasing system ATP-binding protein LolD n=1 Tax=Legionella impletisoli TaxID=343510 RepID=A0A917NBQ8_9GAMM|nr:lipoprotein-releasing ABC transporter ATP-binding protein LolD [Legionella impletisoli]GGI81534.1 lipoprotein-releasing system ATP-binding protein LolD [Legionella impletisoli]